MSFFQNVHTLRVGLTGGIGSGKSAVADMFVARGAFVIDADQLARDTVAPGTPALAEIAALWPEAIAADGSLDRARLSKTVFNDGDARVRLNGIIHPRVRVRAAELEAAQPDGTIVVHMIPLLFEGDYWKQCDRTVVVVAPRETRIARVIAREGWTREAIEARMRAQIDPDKARTLASFVIENDADLATLEVRAAHVYGELRKTAAA
ncbi:MAG: dephospho-CoA kinase [Candidatus Velthaea sp.]